METFTSQVETGVIDEQVYDRSVESLRAILSKEQGAPVTLSEAKELGYELIVFFEALSSDGSEDDETDG